MSKKKAVIQKELPPAEPKPEYAPSPEMVELMAKENVVRMINGDLDNTFQSVM